MKLNLQNLEVYDEIINEVKRGADKIRQSVQPRTNTAKREKERRSHRSFKQALREC